MSKRITIEVAYAKPTSQQVVTVKVATGTTIQAAIECSGILAMFPEINLAEQKVGVFGKARQLSDVVNAGDRIEIYRPLLIDPKAARRAKAKPKS